MTVGRDHGATSSRSYPLDASSVSTCEEHAGCLVVVQHYAVERGPVDALAPAGVVRVTVHRRSLEART